MIVHAAVSDPRCSRFSTQNDVDLEVAGADLPTRLEARRGGADNQFADMHLNSRLGTGAIGAVFKGKIQGRGHFPLATYVPHPPSAGKECVVKRVKMLDAADKEYFKKEVNILR